MYLCDTSITLFLNGLTSITDIQDGYLRSYGKDSRYLEGLTSITDQQIKSRQNDKYLMLPNLVSISEKQAELLSRHEGALYLNKLGSITETQAE